MAFLPHDVAERAASSSTPPPDAGPETHRSTTQPLDRFSGVYNRHGFKTSVDPSKPQQYVQCPAHEDKNASLSVGVGRDGRLLLTCHAGCTYDQVAEAVDLDDTDLFVTSRGLGRIVATYPYTDEQGTALYLIHRFAPKTFRPQQPSGEWNLKGVRRVLYRLSEVINAVETGETIYFVEGEKDADRLARLGKAATCIANGANAPWLPEYTNALSGAADVKIIADNDAPGIAFAEKVRDALTGAVSSVSAWLPALDTKGVDVSDHLDAGYGLDDLRPFPSPHGPGNASQEGAGAPQAGTGNVGGESSRGAAGADETTPDAASGPASASAREPVDDAPMVRPLPEYPLTTMLTMGALGDLLAKGTATGLPPALVGGAALGVAAVAARRSTIQPVRDRMTQIERSSVWVPLLAPRSGGKSPALSIARAPLEALEDRAYEEWKPRRDEWEQTPPKQRQGPRPARVRLTVDDVTTEAFMRIMDTSDGMISAVVDELRTLLSGMTRYRGGKDSGDYARWLSMWDGQSVSFDRVSDGVSIRISRPVVSIVGGLQPKYVGLLGEDEDGSRARWLPHYSPETVTATPTEISDEWNTWVEKTATRKENRAWWLDDATYKTYRDAQARWKELERDPETPLAVEGAASKADRQVLRVALVLAELYSPDQGGGAIPPECLDGAIELIEYVIAVWGVLGGSSGTYSTSTASTVKKRTADSLADWIASKGGKVTRRAILRAAACGIRTAGDLNEVLTEYKALYGKNTVCDETPERGGTKTQVIYHPRCLPPGPSS